MQKIDTTLTTSMSYKIINTLRLLSVDMVDKANSGHPGMPLGCAPAMFVLWCKIMNCNPENPLWEYRDRFVLSNGHGCALLYSMLFLLGYDYSLDDLKSFRQIHSKTPGHPEYNKKLGIEISTGPLGQGIANGVGMAISSKKKGINNNIFIMCGDGCLMEGVSYESASLAGHLGLNNLVLLYDDNGITIDGKTDITFTEDTRSRFLALNWDVLEVVNGDTDINDIYEKLMTAKQSKDKPTIIFIKTTIGYGSIAAGKSSVHGAPLGQTNTQTLKEYFGFDKTKSFFVDEDVKTYFDELKKQKVLLYNEFNATTNTTTTITATKNDILNVINEIDKIKNQEKDYATRESSNIVLKKIVELLPDIIVGSADLAESNKTMVTNTHINKNDFTPKYLHYGIREHAMCSIANGISSCDIIPVVSTFLVFITYCLAPIRMAALSKHQVIYVLTHDSVFLGEDGPTHQPVESLSILRSIPNLLTIRPCDVTEVTGAYQIALEYNGPTAIILSRQTLPNIQDSCSLKMKKGAYIAYEPTHVNDTNQEVNLIIVATGSEVHLAIEIAKKLHINCRVVSMPCCELFDKQDCFYKEEILPKNVKKMSLEAGLTSGWYKYVDFTYGIDQFGESAKIADIKNHFGFTLDKIVEFINKIIYTNIKLCLFDFDGTLTDGNVNIESNGNINKSYNVQDGKGLKTILKEHNIKTCIISGYSQNNSVEVVAKRLNIDYLYQNVDDKLSVINKLLKELDLTYDNITYMGDDINDIDLLKKVKFSGCPNNAVKSVKKICNFHCQRDGGNGAVREFIDFIIKNTKKKIFY